MLGFFVKYYELAIRINYDLAITLVFKINKHSLAKIIDLWQ